MIHNSNFFSRLLLLITSLLLVDGLVACNSAKFVSPTVEVKPPVFTPTLTTTPTPTFTPMPTAVPTEVATIAIPPTSTYVPTLTPFPTVTPPPEFDTKTVFLQYGFYGGDGGTYTDFYFGRDMPLLVIYTDGQVILGNFDDRGRYFLETSISSNEMCNLLLQLQRYGYFEEYESIYSFDETTQYSVGAGVGIVQVNGPIAHKLEFYGPYQEYLIPPLKQSFEFINNYRPLSNTYFVPERLILRIEIDPNPQSDDSEITPWPTTLPHISTLWQDPSNDEVYISGEFIEPVMALFDYRLSGRRFSDEGEVYNIIMRPLLPHENPFPRLNYYSYPQEVYNLPFDCPNIELPIVSPTPTPTSSFTVTTVSTLTGKGRILLAVSQNGNSEIYMMNADGTGFLNLTNHPADDEMASWSPNGQQIAFVSNRSGNPEIYIMDDDGSNVARLTFSSDREYSPRWSPDGKQIVFMSSHFESWDEFRDIYLFDVGTGSQQLLVEDAFSPDWSPDGKFILYSDGRAIYKVEINGSNKTRIAAGGLPVWSPNGQQIAYVHNGELYLINADGTEQKQITFREGVVGGINWSADGEYILYTAHPANSLENEVRVINILSEEAQILLVQNALSSDWFP